MEYSESPFKVIEGKIKEVFKESKGAPFEMADVKTGEVSFFQKVTRVSKAIVDTSNYTKVYKGNSDVFYEFGLKEFLLFYYIVDNLGIHTDRIMLYPELLYDACKMSESTFRRALITLLEKNIIARKKGSSIEFFVNINYVFNGSRLKLRG
jgi:hypothetical protein